MLTNKWHNNLPSSSESSKSVSGTVLSGEIPANITTYDYEHEEPMNHVEKNIIAFICLKWPVLCIFNFDWICWDRT